VKGVDRRIDATVAALRTAVMSRRPLTQQKLVLQQIHALNTPIEHHRLDCRHAGQNQTGRSETSSGGHDSDRNAQTRLSEHLSNVDAIDAFKSQALTSMKTHGRCAERRDSTVARLHLAREAPRKHN